jgi:hypothetical protein
MDIEKMIHIIRFNWAGPNGRCSQMGLTCTKLRFRGGANRRMACPAFAKITLGQAAMVQHGKGPDWRNG